MWRIRTFAWIIIAPGLALVVDELAEPDGRQPVPGGHLPRFPILRLQIGSRRDARQRPPPRFLRAAPGLQLPIRSSRPRAPWAVRADCDRDGRARLAQQEHLARISSRAAREGSRAPGSPAPASPQDEEEP